MTSTREELGRLLDRENEYVELRMRPHPRRYNFIVESEDFMLGKNHFECRFDGGWKIRGPYTSIADISVSPSESDEKESPYGEDVTENLSMIEHPNHTEENNE